MIIEGLKINPEDGLAVAIRFKKITEERAAMLTDHQKELFGYYNVLGLIGVTFTTDAKTRVDEQGNVYREFVYSSPYWATIPQTIDLETFLGLTTEQAERLDNSYIADLVRDETDYIGGGVAKGYLSLQEVFDLTDRQYFRITAENRNIASIDFDGKIVHNYADILHIRTNDPEKATEHKAKALYLLEAIDPEYMPDSRSIIRMLKALSLEEVKAVANFKAEQIDILLDAENMKTLKKLMQPVIDYFPYDKIELDESGRAIGPLKRGPVFAIEELSKYSANQIRSIIAAYDLLDKGIVSVDNAADMQEEEAKVASQLSDLMQDGEKLEDVTGGEFKTLADAAKEISLMDAWALSALYSGIRYVAKLSSAEAYKKARELEGKFDQALETGEIKRLTPLRPGIVGSSLDPDSYKAFLTKHALATQ